jgi:hypothetical protein
LKLRNMYQRLTPKQQELLINGLVVLGVMVLAVIVVALAVPHLCETCNKLKVGG